MSRSCGIFTPVLTLVVLCSTVLAADSGVISGWVYAEDNTEVIGEAKVYIHHPDGDVFDSAYTSEAGWFSAEIMPGEYLVSAGKRNFVRRFYPGQYECSEAVKINVHPGLNTSIAFYLERGGWISGILSSGGKDIEEGLITVLKIDDPDAGWYKSLTLRGSFPRHYELEGLIPGTYKVSARGTGKKTVYFPGVEDFEDATPIEVEPDAGVANVSFSLEPVGSGTISGQVSAVDAPGGIGNVQITAYQWHDFWEDPNRGKALTGIDGRFELQLFAGEYFFYADCDDCYPGSGRIVVYYDNQFDPMYADAVTVAAGDCIEGIDFELDFSNSYNLSISGRMVDEGTGLGLADATVTAIDFCAGQAISSSMTAGNGEFVIGNLPSGAYLVFFSGVNVIPYFYRATENWQNAEIIDLQLNYSGVQSEAITQDYGNQVLGILGRVTSQSGPVSGARVYAYLAGDSRPTAFARTGSSGNYAIISCLVPGSYTVVCDLFGYDKQTYPQIIQLDLLEFPEAENIDFYLEPNATAIAGTSESPRQFEIFENYPNPFNMQTVIPILSSYEGVRDLQMTVYDVLGRHVGSKRVSVNPGMNYIEWGVDDFDGSAGSGLYFYKIGDLPGSCRMILLK